jgi:hypothetical protein
MGWIQPDRWIQAADGADVVLDRAFGQAAPCAEVLGEGVEFPFEFRVGRGGTKFSGNHANLLDCRLLAAGQVTFVRASGFGSVRPLIGGGEKIYGGRKDSNDSFMLIPEGPMGRDDRRSGPTVDGGAARRVGPIVLAELPEQQRNQHYHRGQRRDRDDEPEPEIACDY